MESLHRLSKLWGLIRGTSVGAGDEAWRNQADEACEYGEMLVAILTATLRD
jgi:hypothetical protein